MILFVFLTCKIKVNLYYSIDFKNRTNIDPNFLNSYFYAVVAIQLILTMIKAAGKEDAPSRQLFVLTTRTYFNSVAFLSFLALFINIISY